MLEWCQEELRVDGRHQTESDSAYISWSTTVERPKTMELSLGCQLPSACLPFTVGSLIMVRTQALRTLYSNKLKYASYLKSADSSTLLPLSQLFIAHLCNFPDGTGCMCLYNSRSDVSDNEGSRNGNAPLGEA